MKAYRVERVESSAEMESLLNSALTQGYRYRDAIPVAAMGLLGSGSQTVRFFVVLEHIGVEGVAPSGDTSPGGRQPPLFRHLT